MLKSVGVSCTFGDATSYKKEHYQDLVVVRPNLLLTFRIVVVVQSPLRDFVTRRPVLHEAPVVDYGIESPELERYTDDARCSTFNQTRYMMPSPPMSFGIVDRTC
jgi:hypothetical protein